MKADESVARAVNEAFDKLLDAYGSGRTDEAMKYVSQDDDVTLIEPGEDAFSVGQADVRSSIQIDFETTEGDNPVRVKRSWVSAAGDVAWINGEHEVSVNFRGHDMNLHGRFTAIAKKEGGEWRFHTVHIAAPTPDRPAGQAWPTQAGAGAPG